MATKTRQAMRETIKQRTAERFRLMMKAKRFTFRQLAAASGVSMSTINSFANAKSHVTLAAAVKLANATGCNVADFAP